MRALKIFVLATATIGLSACATNPRGAITADNNPSLYSVHQPVVERSNFVLDLDAGADSLSPAEQARLLGWFRTIELRYGDQLFVEQHRDHPAAGARAGVEAMISEWGLLLRDGAPIVPGTIAPGTIRVIVSRWTASVPSCPDWTVRDVAPHVNTSSNYGCAVNSNLAAMVANPSDLVLGQSGNAGSSASIANRAVRVYRERQPSGAQPTLQSPSTRSGGN